MFALHASITVPTIRKVAVFEPVLFAGQPGVDEFKGVISRGERLVASGDTAAAMAGLAKDAQDSDSYRKSVAAPYRLLGRVVVQPIFCRVLLWVDARMVKGDDVALRDLVPALIPELAQVKATEGTIDDYKNVTADVLLMCGSDAPPLFKGTLAALANVLPHATRVELPGLNHVAAQDQGGKPAVIADQLRRVLWHRHRTTALTASGDADELDAANVHADDLSQTMTFAAKSTPTSRHYVTVTNPLGMAGQGFTRF